MISKNIIYSAIALLAIIGIAVFFLSGHQGAGNQSNAYINQNKVNATNPTTPNATSILFANTQYAQFAYLISSGTLSGQAKAALAGFNISKTQNQNGTATIAITLLADGNKQAVNLNQGDRLYIIETSFGDDGFGTESNLGDDGFVLVNANGYVVQ